MTAPAAAPKKRSNKRQLEALVNVRLLPQERDQVRQYAAQNGLTVGEVLRTALRQASIVG